ncbi:MAG: hypothetical protein ACOX8S_03505 [Christensenellales bacterium]|jgi:hypothetical protein
MGVKCYEKTNIFHTDPGADLPLVMYGKVYEDVIDEPFEAPIGGNFHADPIYDVFYDDETGEKKQGDNRAA